MGALLAAHSKPSNACGYTAFRYISRAFGIPSVLHSETEGGFIPKIAATSLVPPRRSITAEGSKSMSVFMPARLGAPNATCQGTPNFDRVRIAYMSTLAERVRIALDYSGQKKADLASACGIKPPSVSGWLSGDTKSLKASTAVRAAAFLGVNVLWLTEGRGPSGITEVDKSAERKSAFLPPVAGLGKTAPLMLGAVAASAIGQSGFIEALISKDVTQAPERKGVVPLISWVQAGDWSEATDLMQPGVAEDWIETGVKVLAHTFALRVRGDSMEPEFVDGTILVVEPELEANPGDYVIAKNGDGEATFKQLIRDGGDFYLKPLNDRYPIKPLGNARIIGVVREAVKRYR